MTLEKHCGIEQKQSDAPAPIESVEAVPAEVK
jgi:hypothetical protein